MTITAEAVGAIIGPAGLGGIIALVLRYRNDSAAHPPITPAEAVTVTAAVAAHDAGISPEALATVVATLQRQLERQAEQHAAEVKALMSRLDTLQDTVVALREQLIASGITPRP